MLKSFFLIGWRSLIKNKTSSIANIAGLTIGLATSILIMLFVVNEFSYDKFHVNRSDLYLLLKNQQTADGISTGDVTAGPMAASLRTEMPETKYASRVKHFQNQQIRVGDKVVNESGIYAEPDFFNMMTFPAIQGNPVTSLRDESSVLITENTAKKLFGNDNPIGKTLLFNDSMVLKVAALLRDVPANSSIQFNMVLPFRDFEKENPWLTKWDDNRIQTCVQLNPSADVATLNAKLTKLLQERSNDKSVSLFLYPFEKLRLYDSFDNGKPNGGRITMVKLMSLLGLFVLVLACINFMNISTARSEHRAREVGVRKVLGASRRLIIVQFLCEALLIAFLALGLGIGLSQMTLPAFNRFAEKNISFDLLNWRIWLLLAGIGLFTGLMAGSYPSFFLSRFTPVRVLKGLMANGSGGAGLRKVLVTLQFIISIFFIIATIVIYSQIDYVRNRPIGYDQENLIDIHANGALKNQYDIFRNELGRIPGVKDVTAGSDNILQFGSGVNGMDWPGKQPGQDFSVLTTDVQYGWTKTMGLKMLKGRDFDPAFGTDTLALLLNETAVKKMGLKEPVIGAKVGGKTVIGVFQDFVFNNPSGIISPMAVALNTGSLAHVYVRFSNDGHWRQTLERIEKSAKRINPNFPFEFSFTKEGYQKRFEEWSSIGLLATLFGGMAIFISCLGLFGLSSFMAERRGKEMSIRKVFGASSWNVGLSMSKDFLKPVFIALLIVLPVAVWGTHSFLSGIAYHVRIGWEMFSLAGAIAIFIAIATVSYQGIRTARESPANRLRSE